MSAEKTQQNHYSRSQIGDYPSVERELIQNVPHVDQPDVSLHSSSYDYEDEQTTGQKNCESQSELVTESAEHEDNLWQDGVGEKWDYNKFRQNQEMDYNIDIDDLFFDDSTNVRNPDVEIQMDTSAQEGVEDCFDAEILKEIFSVCDPPILWEEISLGAGADDLYMSYEIWRYCKEKSKAVLNVVIMHAVVEGQDIISVACERGILDNLNFRLLKLEDIKSQIAIQTHTGNYSSRMMYNTYKKYVNPQLKAVEAEMKSKM